MQGGVCRVRQNIPKWLFRFVVQLWPINNESFYCQKRSRVKTNGTLDASWYYGSGLNHYREQFIEIVVYISVPGVYCEYYINRISGDWIFVFIFLCCSWIVHTLETCLKNYVFSEFLGSYYNSLEIIGRRRDLTKWNCTSSSTLILVWKFEGWGVTIKISVFELLDSLCVAWQCVS